MPRYDKYEPKAGGFRAPLAAAIAEENAFDLVGVGLDTSGRVVVGAGDSGIVGVLIAHGVKEAGDPVDVMTSGDIVDLDDTVTAGSNLFAATDGTVDGTDTGTPVGFVVARAGTTDLMLVVRVGATPAEVTP